MSTLALEVLMAGRRAGRVTSVSGRLGLRYHDAYRAGDDPTPLSVSLPVQVAGHGHELVSAFLWGLLPDNDRVPPLGPYLPGVCSQPGVVAVITGRGRLCRCAAVRRG